jgi:hypothetical protein
MEQRKKNKKGMKRSLSVFEISILVISLFAFAYFIGNDFKFVSARAAETIIPPEVSLPSAAPAPTGVAKTILPEPALPAAGAGVPLAEPALPAGASIGPGGELVVTAVTPPVTPTPMTWSKFAGNIMKSWNSILINAAIAFALYYGTKWIGGWLCPTCSQNFLDSLALALSLGYGIGSGLGILIGALGGNSLPIFGLAGAGFGLIGLGVGILVFLIFYRDKQISAIVYSCYPWQPQSGGADCDKCNKGEFPCTKYKCQSLGQGCELLNPGTKDELCTWVNRNDIAPPLISAWDGVLDKEKYQYLPDTARLPPDKGVIIKYKQTSDGCIPPFSRITYGITLDKPGKCKADVVRKNSFSEMLIPLSNTYYLYNHTILSVHAGANESEAEGISLPNGGNYEVFIRCESKNGYSNTGTFVFKYCVSDEPDTTPPTIELTNPINGMPVQSGRTSQDIEIYTNKPADCRWSHNDEDYETMAGAMTCSQSITEMNANMFYKCTTTLTGLKDSTENKFYFNCKSYPLNAEADRYKMSTNYVYKLIGTRPLVLDSISPVSGTVLKDATESVKVTLAAKTSAGYNNGAAKCYFKKTSESDKSYVLFMDTNSYQSSQDLWLPSGSYKYTINCCDLGGNCATKETSFTVDTDFQPPIIARAYNEGGSLQIITTESAECVYDTTSCSYTFEDGLSMTSSDGINHFTEWNTDSSFYVKCKDEFGNQPVPDGCSMVIRPFNGA